MNEAHDYAVGESQLRTICEPMPLGTTIDLTPHREVRIRSGEHFVATTPEHLIECLAWLLTNIDTDTIVTKDGIEVDG